MTGLMTEDEFENAVSQHCKILILTHSNDLVYGQAVLDELNRKGADSHIIHENLELSLSDCAKKVTESLIIFVVASYTFSLSDFCLELLHFSKDRKKIVYSMPVHKQFIPSGALGAITMAWGKFYPLIATDTDGRDDVWSTLRSKFLRIEPPGEGVSSDRSHTAQQGDTIAVIAHADGVDIAQLVCSGEGVSNHGHEPLRMSRLPVLVGNENSLNDELIQNCRIYVPVLTQGFGESALRQQEFELARRLGKRVVPVMGHAGALCDWLSLAIAGKLYYPLLSRDVAYRPHTNVPDSTPMNDFIYAVQTSWNNPHDVALHGDQVRQTQLTQ
jgi:hypothetical protein